MNKEPIKDKKTYTKIVKFTLGSMMDLARTDASYNFLADMVDYYLSKIQPDGILTQEELRILRILRNSLKPRSLQKE